MPRGGHFGPSEEPQLVVDELRAFFGPLGSAAARVAPAVAPTTRAERGQIMG